MKRISKPIESLMQDRKVNSTLLRADFLVIGSGYGGAVAAMRLASGGSDGRDEPVREVVVLERGKEYSLGDFPYDIEDLPSHVRMVREGQNPAGYSDALFNLYIGGDNTADGAAADTEKGKTASVADVLVGSGLGGTSLINANVAEEPLPHVFRKPAWPREIRDTPNPLASEFAAVREQIGVVTHTSAAGQQFPKYTALQRLGKSLGHEARPASIAVTTGANKNGVGVQQSPCTDCGNCVTGCNVGAKNTLDRNLLRLAKTRGARFFTGATVQTIEPHNEGDFRWKIIVQPTVQPVGTVENEAYVILAKNVILAAGSLGSTEILLRSSKNRGLALSNKIGEKFSTNGDGLIMSYGQTQAVRAVAAAAQKNPIKKVGPTITGIIQTGKLSIEEATVPASMARVFSELVTTGAMLQRMADRALPTLFSQSGHDPLAASMAVADHCQALLVMGDDGANGRLSLSGQKNTLQIGYPKTDFKLRENEALVASNDLVKKQDRDLGLDGGQYVPNPLWQLVPTEAAGVLSGQLPVGRVLTVHPLGGCAMADTVTEGVVNHAGQVFNDDGTLHAGLYVLDGSIIPSALEVNPFMTIAALAWRNCGLILESESQSKIPESTIKKVSPEYVELGEVPDRQRDRPQPTVFDIQEQLIGQVDTLSPWFRHNLSAADQKRLTKKDGLVVQVVASNDNAEHWLENPGKSPLEATMYLYTNPLPVEMVETFNPVGVEQAHLRDVPPFMTLRGRFTVLSESDYNCFKDFTGGLKAVFTYIKRRGIKSLSFSNKTDSWPQRIVATIKGVCVFFNIGILQSRFRRMSYDFTCPETGISIQGAKVLGYSCELQRMWPELINLSIAIKEDDTHTSHAKLRVNAEYLVEPGLVEVRKSAHLPQSLLFAGGLAAFVARCLFATNFWEFGGLEYRQQPDGEGERETKDDTLSRFPILTTKSGAIKPVHFTPSVPVRSDAPDTVELILTRYPRLNAKPILLLHGLAQGSQIFWTRGINNLAVHFYDAGYDVWLLDYRLSNLILPGMKDRNWSMDEIARYDIPTAIDTVCRETGYAKTLVFGHCVGACTLAMAALRVPGLSDKVEAAVTNAIHPWVLSSPGNRFRSKLGSFMREWVPESLLDPNPPADSGALQNAMDRLAFGLARINEQPEDDHQGYGGSALVQSICDRMSFLYGRMWNHKNLAPATHDEFVEMLGPAPVGVYQQLYYYAQLRRITDKDGENTYLDRTRIRNNWKFPILFIHGNDSRVFNPHSARRSAIRLREILNPPGQVVEVPVRYRIYPDYGHMDVIFGKEAYRDCFDDYVEFFEDPASFQKSPNEMDWPEPYEARPVTGPVLRAAWVNHNKIYLRLWAELHTNVSDLPTRLVAEGGVEAIEFEIESSDTAPFAKPRFRFLDIEIADPASKIELSVRGNIPNHGDYSGAKLMYDEQSWLLRLRAISEVGYQKRMCFVVGSCRYPGSIVDNALSDCIYEAMREHTTTANGAQLLFLIGDQIYADAMDQLYDTQSLNTKYTDRYRRAFSRASSSNFARLVENIPTHFTLDDHEIDDNWSGLPPETQPHDKSYLEYDYAITMAKRFLSSGRNQVPVLNRATARPFYYALSHPQECDFPTFVADTRSERTFRKGNSAGDYDLFSAAQDEALKDWLLSANRDFPDAPKFIVSGSIITPLPQSYHTEGSTWRHEDGWAGYPGTLESLFEFIAEHAIEKVVFVGGDAHIASVSRIKLSLEHSGAETMVWQIVSSGLYAPVSFANSHIEDFVWDTWHPIPTHCGAGLSVECKNTRLSEHHHQFVRVDASVAQVTVTCFDESNKSVASEHLFP